MGERIDEFKGEVKQGLGKLTGNVGLEAEGKLQTGAARAKRKTKGVLHEVGGAVQEGFGKLTGDLVTQGKGTAKKLHGKVERTG